jgi:DNA-binding CsgD family transcriptional regulator
MKKILLLIFLPFQGFCQNTIGLPDVINYSKQSYSAGLQNWDIRQDKNGIIYTANNEGLLSFDGRYWALYPLPNRTIVRSVEIGKDNRIYVGGQDELGYFAPGGNGRLQYFSLIPFITEKDKSFGDVWDIVSNGNDIFFRSVTGILKFSDSSFTSFAPVKEWTYMGSCKNDLYAYDYNVGMMRFEQGAWRALPGKNEIPLNEKVTSIMPMPGDSALVTTLKSGLFLLSKNGISKINSLNNVLFGNERIYAAIPVNDEWIALATSNNGIYITDLRGNIIQGFSRTEGLQNNNVLNIFLDNQKNLWLGLDNGIDLINYNSAIKQINPFLKNSSGYTAIIHNNRFYAGTSSGLYSVPLQQTKDLSFSKGNFSEVNNTKGQTWCLAEINGQLLLGHHEGAFIIKDNTAKHISTNPGFWNFIPLARTSPATQIVAGNYNGLQFFNYKEGSFSPSQELIDFTESSRFVAFDKYENIWVSHPYHGVFRIKKNNNGKYMTYSYTGNQGLPSALNNHVYKIKNEVVVATDKGIYVYNQQNDAFEPSPYYKKLLGDQSIRYLKEDHLGNTWYIHEKTAGVIDITGKEPAIILLPELNNKMVSGLEFIYPFNENNIFLGGEKGFFHINYEKYKKTVPNLQAQIRIVRIINKTDSVLFGGYFKNVNEKQEQDANHIPEISSGWKTIRFEYSSPLFGYQSNLEYSYRLNGFEGNWSEWSKRTEKEYTNLPAGTYKFEVKVRNNLGNESGVASYSLKVMPPWYQTIWAGILYLIIFLTANYLFYKWLRKKFRLQRAKYEAEQKRLLYIHELEINKTESELVALRNEKLEADINFKNSELASSAMHLVKKGELLTKLKSELSQVIKGLDNPIAIDELKKMIKSLSEDDNMDQEWENFTKHFDKVHSDFVVGLKEKHPNISASELKLCAYLRMNLTTKEIAQLMNISVRGVEISRYRLRKKLGISAEQNLFDYLINIHTKT